MANANGNDGISANRRCNISGCIVNDNTADGILLFSQNIVSGNTCANNGNGGDGAGIRAFPGSASDNLIEGNNCTGNDRGIDVDGTGNIIIKNSCSGNTTNYVIAANNRYGPIVNITASGTAAVNGNSATSTIGSTDPHANFAY
jgi:parallel beta-helix repeat protein